MPNWKTIPEIKPPSSELLELYDKIDKDPYIELNQTQIKLLLDSKLCERISTHYDSFTTSESQPILTSNQILDFIMNYRNFDKKNLKCQLVKYIKDHNLNYDNININCYDLIEKYKKQSKYIDHLPDKIIRTEINENRFVLNGHGLVHNIKFENTENVRNINIRMCGSEFMNINNENKESEIKLDNVIIPRTCLTFTGIYINFEFFDVSDISFFINYTETYLVPEFTILTDGRIIFNDFVSFAGMAGPYEESYTQNIALSKKICTKIYIKSKDKYVFNTNFELIDDGMHEKFKEVLSEYWNEYNEEDRTYLIKKDDVKNIKKDIWKIDPNSGYFGHFLWGYVYQHNIKTIDVPQNFIDEELNKYVQHDLDFYNAVLK